MRDQRENPNGTRCMVKPTYTYAQINIFDRKTLYVINILNYVHNKTDILHICTCM